MATLSIYHHLQMQKKKESVAVDAESGALALGGMPMIFLSYYGIPAFLRNVRCVLLN